MKIKSIELSVATLLLITFTTLSGCGNSPESKSATGDSNTPPSTAAPTVSSLEPMYEATLADGIDFRRAGYPNFLSEVTGMSGLENWGRWTEAAAGPVARFRFKQHLPPKFTLEIKANAFVPNQGAAIKVRVGTVEKTFTVPKGGVTYETYSLDFDGTNGADTIEIIPPKPTSPAELNMSTDARKLGVSLVSLKIR